MSVKYNQSEVRLAVIGCGNWGKNHVRVFHELGVLAAVCDNDPIKSMILSEKYSVPALNFNDILISDAINAVVIVTPSHTHESIAKLCLEAHKHVFIEKPFCLNTATGVMLTQLAQTKQRILMVGHLLQYHPAFNTIKKFNEDGKLGNLQYIYSNRLNFGKFPTEKSVLWDYAPHDISMILSLFKKLPFQVFAISGNHFEHTTMDATTLHLQFEGKQHAKIFVSWLHPFKEQKMVVVGDKGMIVFDDLKPWEQKLTFYAYPEEWTDGLPRPFIAESEVIVMAPAEPLKIECQHFLDSIAQNTQPATNGNEATGVISVLEAAGLSIATQRCIELSTISTSIAMKKSETIDKKTHSLAFEET